MEIQCRFLQKHAYHDVYQTFLDAFSDYVVDMSAVSEQSFLNRAVKNGIDFECSVAVKLLNVSHTDSAMLGFVQQCGFDRLTSRYEMALEL